MKQALTFAGVVGLVMLSGFSRGEPLIKDGQTLAFLGDSITQQGARNPAGYVRLVVRGLESNGIKVKTVEAGISGHKSNDMLGRLEKDVLSKKPDFMTLSCGVNDVWHGERGVPLEAYQQNINAIFDQAAAAGVKVVILTATMIGEDASNPNNQKLVPYNDFLRDAAKQRSLPLADLNADMQAAVLKAKAEGAAKTKGDNYLTGDGVHMAAPGDMMMAEGILRALGLDAEQIAKAKADWLSEAGPEVKMTLSVSLGTFLKVQEAAAKAGKSSEQYLGELALKALPQP